jgi:DNA-binding NarL/FixJ family response regulator
LQSAADATITDPVNLIVQRSPARLSAREREVLALVAAGISNKGIARELRVSPNTVKFHIAAILDKLDAGTRAEAVVAALRRGELSL